jgi:hypothetical protein
MSRACAFKGTKGMHEKFWQVSQRKRETTRKVQTWMGGYVKLVLDIVVWYRHISGFATDRLL